MQQQDNDLENLKQYIFAQLGGDVRLGEMSPENMNKALLNSVYSGEKQKWADQMQKTLQKYELSSQASQDLLNEVQSFHEAYKKASPFSRGALSVNFLSKLNPQSAIALKDQAKLILSGTQGYKGMSRILLKDLELLEKGGLNVKLPPESEEFIYNMTRMSALRDVYNARLANSLSEYITNPNLIDRVVTEADKFYNFLDDKAEFIPENVAKIENYDTPLAPYRIGRGKVFLPEDYTDVISYLKKLPENSNRSESSIVKEVISRAISRQLPPNLAFEKLRYLIGGSKNAKTK